MRRRRTLGLRAVTQDLPKSCEEFHELIISANMEQRDWLTDFKDQCRRNLERTVEERMLYGFCYVYKPILDDVSWRSFNSTAEYRQWCRENLPVYLGYGEREHSPKKGVE